MKAKNIGNGCGPKWLPGWLVPDLCMRPVCDLHDLAYYTGGSEKDRAAADRAFLEGGLELCTHRHRPVIYVYYGLIRIMGWITFNHTWRKRLAQKAKGLWADNHLSYVLGDFTVPGLTLGAVLLFVACVKGWGLLGFAATLVIKASSDGILFGKTLKSMVLRTRHQRTLRMVHLLKKMAERGAVHPDYKDAVVWHMQAKQAYRGFQHPFNWTLYAINFWFFGWPVLAALLVATILTGGHDYLYHVVLRHSTDWDPVQQTPWKRWTVLGFFYWAVLKRDITQRQKTIQAMVGLVLGLLIVLFL